MATVFSIKNSAVRFTLVMLACVSVSYSVDNVVNFNSVITVGAFLEIGDTLWAASSGGLVAHDLRGGGNKLIASAKLFPDPHLTALCRDRRGNLWAGSRRGYLYKRTPRGQFSVYSSYKTSGWGITALYTYGNLIVVGSDKGVSLFNPERGVVVRNAVSIADFGNPRVNAIAASGDTLFLGCDDGVAYLDSLDVVPLSHRNFYDPGIWNTRKAPEVPVPVVSLVDSAGVIVPNNAPAAMFHGRLFTARGDSLIANDTLWNIVSPSSGRVLALHNEGNRRLWIGTTDQYYFSFDGDPPRRHVIDGPTIRSGERVAVAPNGDLWVTPGLVGAWHYGIYRYDGRMWHIYNEYTHGHRFGYIGDGGSLGIAFDGGGKAWVGLWGGNVKHIDPVRNTVAQLIVGNADFDHIGYYDDGAVHDYWGKVDALAVDSYGYLWVSVWGHNSGNILCYNPRVRPNSDESDPVRAGYRWFFNEPPYKTRNITLLSVDIDDRIFAYDPEQSRLTVFRHGGDPLRSGIDVDTSYERFGTVSSITSAPDGTTYITGQHGLLRIARGSGTIDTVDNTMSGLTSIALQGNVLWLGSMSNGVLRYNVDTGEKRWLGEADGLPSDNVRSLSIDEQRGYLWVLTENAVSRFDVGRLVTASRNEPMQAFPNVFSISRNTQGARHITFARLEPRSTVSIYTVNGALAAKVTAEYFTEKEWRASWTPKRTLAPGTYIAVSTPSGKRAKILLKP